MMRALAITVALSGCLTTHAWQHPGQKMPLSAYAVDVTAAGAGLAVSVAGYPEHPPLAIAGLALFFALMVPPAFAPKWTD